MKSTNTLIKSIGSFLLSSLLAVSAYAQSLSIAPSAPDRPARVLSPAAEPDRPWYAFWQKSSTAEAEDSVSPAADDAFSAPVLAPEEPTWLLQLTDGSRTPVLASSLSFDIPAAPAEVPFSVETFSFVTVVPPSDDPDNPAPGFLRATLRANPAYAIEAPLPRTLRVRTIDGSRLSVSWAEVAFLADPESPSRRSATAASIPAAASFLEDDTPYTLSIPFPICFIPVKTDFASLSVPSWLLSSIAVNSDRSVTLRSVYGDILTGSIPPFKRFPGFENATSVVLSHDNPPAAPASANQYRLASGDILVASPLSAPSAAARSSLRSAAAPAAAAPYILAPAFAPDTSLTFAADSIEAVATLSSLLPPAAAKPFAPSARAMDEILVPAGTFHLGSAAPNAPADESPAVPVAIDAFYLASTPVTVAQFAAFIDDASYRPKPEARSWNAPGFVQSPNDPVVAVSWRDAAAYCNWLSKKARLSPAYSIPSDERYPVVLDLAADGYRLPLEAEWEYAARNLGKPVSFPWGDDPDEAAALSRANFAPSQANAVARHYALTAPVKSFPASPLGFYDLAGNVFEWCQDVYSPDAYAAYYATGDISPIVNPTVPERRVMRGGSYLSPLRALRTTSRAFGLETAATPAVGSPRVGFRVARNAP